MTKRRHKDLDNYLCSERGRPSLRERWVAFHRLYRLAKAGAGGYHSDAANSCLYILAAGTDWTSLMNEDCHVNGRGSYPPVIRRRLLEGERRRRLFGPGYRWLDECRAVAQHLRGEGVEVTPEEVAATRHKIVRIAREKATKQGFVLPADDDAVLRILRTRD